MSEGTYDRWRSKKRQEGEDVGFVSHLDKRFILMPSRMPESIDKILLVQNISKLKNFP